MDDAQGIGNEAKESEKEHPSQLQGVQDIEALRAQLGEHTAKLNTESAKWKAEAEGLNEKAKELFEKVQWTQTITYLGFIVVVVMALGIALDVFFNIRGEKTPPSIVNVYEQK